MALEAWRGSGSVAAASGRGWLPYAIVLGLLLVSVLLSGAAARPPRPVVLAVALLLALACWATLSLTWSPVPSLARDEGLLTALYAVCLALPAVSLRRPSDRQAALVAVTLLLAGVAIAVGAVLAFGSDPVSRFSGGRLYFPITYANAQGAFFALAFWPAVLLASKREGGVLVRTAMTSAAATLLAAVTLTQSKGAVIGLAGSLLVLPAASPGRLRLLVPVSVAVVIDVVAFRPLTEPFRNGSSTAARHAGYAVLAAGVAGLLTGVAYALVDRRVDVGERASRTIGRALAALALVAAAGAAGALFVTVSHPGRWADDRWHSFKHLKQTETGGSHFVNLGSNRYDYWRVTVHEIKHHPLAGCGARCFGPEYLLHRTSHESPARAHSLPLEVLAEQGLIGFALLAAALGLLLAALARLAKARDAVATAALGTATVWLIHSFVDWIWTFPAVTASAFAIVGIGLARNGAPLAPRAARSAAAVAAAVVILAFVPTELGGWLAEHGSPRWASRFDPVSSAPVIAEALQARTAQDEVRLLRKAARMEPRVVATQYFLGVAYLNLGRRAEARAQLERARRLDPRNPSVLRALALARRQ
jgi:O-antigen ligase